MARQSAGRSALDRVVRVLESFEQDKPVLTPAQIARRAELPLPTVYRIVAELTALGLLEKDVSGVRVGIRLWEIASRAPRGLGLREAAMPFMEDLHAATRHHTQLAVLEGHEVLFIERLSARRAVVNVTKIGGRLPVHASASGLVLLAHAPTSVQEDVLSEPMHRYTDRTPVRPAQVRRLLAAVRQRGYVACVGFIHPDAQGIAVPVRGPESDVVAALAVVVPCDSDPMNHVPALTAAARGISRSMGRSGVPGSTFG
jgi:DNA-binding IclR family transcriptional regulator